MKNCHDPVVVTKLSVPHDPSRLHKEHFACAFTAGEALAAFETAFDDESPTLTVRHAAAGCEVCADLQVPEQVGESAACFATVLRLDGLRPVR